MWGKTDTIGQNKCDAAGLSERFPTPSTYKNKAQAECPEIYFMLPKKNECFTYSMVH